MFLLCVVANLPQIGYSAPANRPARPQMPASFDRETVARLLADIDQPRNASMLKVGYFLRRGQPALPLLEGFELLQAVAEAEPVGTNKWFRLQNLLAVVAFRVPGADTSQGFDAYQAIFEHAADADKVGAAYPLRQSILEFVDSIPGRFNDLGLSRDERTKELLLGAWTAYAVALAAPMKGAAIAEPDWNRALVKSGSLEAFGPVVEKVIADPAQPKSFGLLIAAAEVIAPKDPDKALGLWAQAKPLIPQSQGVTDVNEAARLYRPLVELLVARERLPDAIANQREFVALSAHGQARLMLLLRQSGDIAATDAALEKLREPAADPREIMQATAGLFLLARDAKAPDAKAGQQAMALLQSYMAPTRTRDFTGELDARLALGNAYLRGRQWKEAEEILTFERPDPQTIPRHAQSALRAVERMKEQVQKAAQAEKN